MFNATFNNISVIFVEETGVPREIHRFCIERDNSLFYRGSQISTICFFSFISLRDEKFGPIKQAKLRHNYFKCQFQDRKVSCRVYVC